MGQSSQTGAVARQTSAPEFHHSDRPGRGLGCIQRQELVGYGTLGSRRTCARRMLGTADGAGEDSPDVGVEYDDAFLESKGQDCRCRVVTDSWQQQEVVVLFSAPRRRSCHES